MSPERIHRERVGLKPNAELRKALDEVDECMNFFNKGNFIDYFRSINEVYLNNQGKIEGPTPSISSTLAEDSKLKNHRLLELDQTPGGISIGLDWEEAEDKKRSKKHISLSLNYKSQFNDFDLYLFASVESKFGTETESGLLNTSTSLQRNFLLNPEVNLPKYVDDLLLTFTNELFESGIL